MADRVKSIQILGLGTKGWKSAGLYPFAAAVMVIIGGLMIRFFILLFYDRRRMRGLVSFSFFLGCFLVAFCKWHEVVKSNMKIDFFLGKQ
jgi:hypothetical protein